MLRKERTVEIYKYYSQESYGFFHIFVHTFSRGLSTAFPQKPHKIRAKVKVFST
jgi:hypothetical protein